MGVVVAAIVSMSIRQGIDSWLLAQALFIFAIQYACPFILLTWAVFGREHPWLSVVYAMIASIGVTIALQYWRVRLGDPVDNIWVGVQFTAITGCVVAVSHLFFRQLGYRLMGPVALARCDVGPTTHAR